MLNERPSSNTFHGRRTLNDSPKRQAQVPKQKRTVFINPYHPTRVCYNSRPKDVAYYKENPDYADNEES